MVVEVVELDDRVIKCLSNLSISSSIWSQIVAVKKIGSFGEGVAAEEGEEVDSVLSWKTEAISDRVEESWDSNRRVIMSILMNWSIINWIWDWITSVERWWRDQKDLWSRIKREILLSKSNIFILESLSIFMGYEISELGISKSHDNNTWLRS